MQVRVEGTPIRDAQLTRSLWLQSRMLPSHSILSLFFRHLLLASIVSITAHNLRRSHLPTSSFPSLIVVNIISEQTGENEEGRMFFADNLLTDKKSPYVNLPSPSEGCKHC